MIHSLRVRLLLTLTIVVAVAVGAVALLASQVSSSELQRYIDRDVERNQRLVDTVLRAYGQIERGADAQTLFEQIARDLDERIVLVDARGVAIADSAGERTGQAIGCTPALSAVVVTIEPARCAAAAGLPADQLQNVTASSSLIFFGLPLSNTLSLSPAPVDQFNLGVGNQPTRMTNQLPPLAIRRAEGARADPLKQGFADAVNRSLLVAAGAAGLAALLLALALARGILGQVGALTRAARLLEQGDLGQRVPVRSRDEIGALGHAFNAMADALARTEQLRRHLIGDVAHELRTPLTNIRGYLEALRDGVAEPEPAVIDSLYEEALLLNRLIDDLQDLALAEAGQLRLARQPTSLAACVGRATTAARPAAANKQLQLQVDLPPDLPPIHADPERIGQVLRNLLNNAVIHTPPGGAIVVSAACDNAAVRVTVRDTGAGIAPEDLPYIFERFFRADRSRARATGGSGLGLAIVRQLVQLHGGRVWAESAPGAGATFSFTLPLAE